MSLIKQHLYNQTQNKMKQTFLVKFVSDALNSPEYIGPFYSEDEANDYADCRNGSLALSGIPSSVASYSVDQ